MKKVFIVDDELLSRQSLKSGIIWENFGYRLCGEAANGKQALELIATLRPDVVFTDIKMPVMDGWSFFVSLGRYRILPRSLF